MRVTAPVAVASIVELSHPARTIHRTMRHTTFRFALDPTMRQQQALVRHAGASRYAYNQCLRLLADSLSARETDPSVDVPWSGFDLIEKFNQWKRSEAAGRTFAVAGDGTITKRVTGLAWRHEVSAQVFEEAAVDLGRALAAFSDSRSGTRVGRTIGFPKPKRKGRCKDSFRLRNKTRKNGRCSIRIGEDDPRSVTLPTIGTIRVYNDTRRLRRLLRPVRQFDSRTGEEFVYWRGVRRAPCQDLVRNDSSPRRPLVRQPHCSCSGFPCTAPTPVLRR
jgi:transposase